MSDIIPIYTPKKSCPRNLGHWYCDKCRAKHLEESSLSDYPIPMLGCGRWFDDKRCGITHLGYELCDECRKMGRESHLHIGEYEIVAEIAG